VADINIVGYAGLCDTARDLEIEVVTVRGEGARGRKHHNAVNQQTTAGHFLQNPKMARALDDSLTGFFAGVGFPAQHA